MTTATKARQRPEPKTNRPTGGGVVTDRERDEAVRLRNTNRNTNTNTNTTILRAARGPMLVVAVAVSFVVPYLHEHCTVRGIVHLCAVGLGLAVVCFDWYRLAERWVRTGANSVLDRFVLDDVLRAIYHPTDGLWACCVGTYVGASAMYGLPMTDEERTELIRSSLYLRDERSARSVLLEPGGCKALLPEPVRQWLQPLPPPPRLGASSDSTATRTTTDSSEAPESNKSAPDCDALDIVGTDGDDGCDSSMEDEPHSNINGTRSFREGPIHGPVDSGARHGPSEAGTDDTSHANLDPLAIFFRIVRNMALQRIKSCARALPRSRIETLGVTAAVAMGIQLALRRRAHRRSPLICAGIAALSAGTLLSREAMLGNIYDAQSMKIVCKDTALRMLEMVKGKCAAKKQFVAMLVLNNESARANRTALNSKPSSWKFFDEGASAPLQRQSRSNFVTPYMDGTAPHHGFEPEN
eukprot:jgi/Psemu1/5292/gm1.5292_g